MATNRKRTKRTPKSAIPKNISKNYLEALNLRAFQSTGYMGHPGDFPENYVEFTEAEQEIMKKHKIKFSLRRDKLSFEDHKAACIARMKEEMDALMARIRENPAKYGEWGQEFLNR